MAEEAKEDGNVSVFGETAKGLSRSPLQIIALFIVLVYGFAALVVGAGTLTGRSDGDGRGPLTWFLVCFPVLVLGVFTFLVVRHHRKLYGPGDFRRDEAFLQLIRDTVPAKVRKLPEAQKQGSAPSAELSLQPGYVGMTSAAPEVAEAEPLPGAPPGGDPRALALANARRDAKEQSRGLALVHTVVPSRTPGQEYDIFVYLVEDSPGALAGVARAEFFFGRYWGNRVFEGVRSGDTIGVRTAAYGTFLATCRVTFQEDGTATFLHRYIDFEMGKILQKAAGQT